MLPDLEQSEASQVCITVLAAVATVTDAQQVLDAVRRGVPGLGPVAYFHDDGLQLVLARTGLDSPFGRPYPRYLLLDLAARPAGTDRATLVMALPELPAVRDLLVAESAADRERLWQLYRGQPAAVAQTAGCAATLEFEFALSPQALPAFEQRLPDVLRGVSRAAMPILHSRPDLASVHLHLIGAALDDHDGAVTEAVLGLATELGAVLGAEVR